MLEWYLDNMYYYVKRGENRSAILKVISLKKKKKQVEINL